LMVCRLLCVLERNKMRIRFLNILLIITIGWVNQAVYGLEEIVQALEGYMRNYLSGEVSVRFATDGIKSGFRSNMLIMHYKNELDAGLFQQYFKKVLARPEREKSVPTPSGYFILHWDESGTHSVPLLDSDGNEIPDYIDSAAVIFDYVWKMEIDSLGFQPPPDSDGNPVTSYDIYFSELKSMGWYGATWPDAQDIPEIPGLNFTSYIEVDRDFSSGLYTLGLNGLRVTAAHEFNHAIQLGYNYRDEDLFFYEMTSTWAEDALFPQVNDYFQYLPILFENVSGASFDRFSENDPYPYGNALYLHMLTKEFSRSICSTVWQEIKNYRVVEALRRVLSTRGVTWLESLSSYGVWLYYTGNRAQTNRYLPNAELYDQVSVKNDDIHIYGMLDKLKKEMEHEANRYLQITNITSPRLQIGVLGEDTGRQGYHLLQRSLSSSLFIINEQSDLQISEPDTVVLLLTNARDSYSIFSVVEEMTATQIDVYPNPLIVSNHNEKVNFINIQADASIYIYTISGNLVAKIIPDTGSSIVSWDIRNIAGRPVASGIYLYQVQGSDNSKIGKLVIVR
jgi:hypothetical protein